MNRILFEPGERDGQSVALRDRRARHIREVLRAKPGDTLRVGELGSLLGTARVESLDGDEARLAVVLDQAAPEPWIDLLLALPRPKALGRLWAQLAALGVGRIILINAARVERCYFDTHWLDPAVYTPLLTEGLEQAGATRLPEVRICRRFKAYVEDELARDYAGSPKFLAHPGPAAGTAVAAMSETAQPVVNGAAAAGSGGPPRPLLAIGPEGGWTSYELEQLETRGFMRLSLGPRTLRTDTACIALLGRLMT